MKVTSDNVKAAAMIGGIAIVGFLAYRAFRVGTSAAQTVTETIDRASTAVNGAVSYVSDIPARVDDYTGWVRDFWTGVLAPPVKEGAYPEAGPIRSAQSAAESEAIRIRYADPSAGFETLSGPIPFYNYGTAPAGLGTDSIIGAMPQDNAPDSFAALSEPSIIVTEEYFQ